MKGFYLMPHPPLMIPDVGRGQEKMIQDTLESCELIGKEIKDMDVETIIIVTPHGTIFRDAVAMVTSNRLCGDLSKFGVSEVSMDFEIDKELTDSIIKNASNKGVLVAKLDEDTSRSYNIKIELDHGAMVPLYYIGKYKKYKLVHITYGLLSKLELYKFGMAVSEAVKACGHNAVFIASGDLSHRLKNDGPFDYSPYGKKFDEQLMNILSKGDMEKLFNINPIMIKEAGECGMRSLYILAGSMDSLDIKGKVLSYEGTFGVGYGVVKFESSYDEKDSLYNKLIINNKKIKTDKLSSGDIYTQLARRSLYYYYDNNKPMDIENSLSKELQNVRRGVFVSLKKEGDLRGCIGTISPTTSCVAEEIIKNAISAATSDPRFSKVEYNELPELDISVDVLYEPEICTKEDLDVKEYGVIVTCGNRRGLLLPNLEGVDKVDYQLSIALEKGSISRDENYIIERFKVERHKENNLDD